MYVNSHAQTYMCVFRGINTYHTHVSIYVCMNAYMYVCM